MRTETEKLQFALICKEIEEEGGDVLGYVEMNWPSYSPRGTWHMLQREYLHRAIYSQTEGRPKKMSEKEKEQAERKRKERMSAEDTARALMACAEKGGNLTDCLTMMGFKNPSSALANVKVWARDHRPAWYPQIANMSLRNGYIPPTVKPGKAPVDEKTGERPLKEPKAENRVVFNGKEYEKAEGEWKPVNEYRELPSPTLCEPTKPDNKPTDADSAPTGLEVVGVRSKVRGNYMKPDIELSKMLGDNEEFVHLIWRDVMTHDERSLSLSVSEWMKLAEEIPQAMRQLGLISP